MGGADPQAFSLALYRKALEKARAAGQSYTDDCQLIEAAGGSVKLTMGDYRNIKLTTPEDLLAAGPTWAGKEGKRPCASATGTTSTGWWRGGN